MVSKSVLAATAAAVMVLAGASSALASNTLYGIDDATNSLVTINPEAATITVVGSLGVAGGDFGDLTYDSNHGVAYWAAGRGNNSLYTVDLATGAATLVGSHNVNDLFGLAYDTGNDTLYGVDTSGNFYSLNTATGAATQLGSNNGVYPGGLAYVAATDTLYELSAGSENFYTLSLSNGAATLFAAGGSINDNGVTWDASRGRFFADDFSGNVFSYDANGGSRATVISGADNLDGIIAVGGGGGAVPEPATWAMMLLGFGGLGAVIRRRRASAALATA